MSEIRVEAKDAFGTKFAHLYLVFVNDQGQRYVTSLDSSKGSSTDPRWNITQINTPWSRAKEFKDIPVDDIPHRVLDFGDRDPHDIWNIMTQLALEFQRQDLKYEIVKTNSAAFISALVHAVGLDLIDNLPDYLPNEPEPVSAKDVHVEIPGPVDARADATGSEVHRHLWVD